MTGESPGHRIKLCAIAQNEGAYLAHWIHHHLYFGFDAVTVWVNGSDDSSVAIMEVLSAAREQISFRVVDDLLQDSMRRGKYFQHRAYIKLARRARRQGFTHAAFLDLDEYWLPTDFASSIHDFVPLDDQVNVVSFPWWFDVPDVARPAFASPVAESVELVADRHVKSVVRLDDRIQEIRPHTAITTDGTRLLVREPFPMASGDEARQQHGSFILDEHLASSRSSFPEAIVVHAVHRSPAEYLASLKKTIRRAESASCYRTNRDGYRPSPRPALTLRLPTPLLTDYLESYERFLDETGVRAHVHQARDWSRSRTRTVTGDVVENPLLMEQMRTALRGLPSPELDERYPGWDHHLEWWVDRCVLDDGSLSVQGWAYTQEPSGAVEFALRGGDGTQWSAEVVISARADLRDAHPQAPFECGYEVTFPEELRHDPAVKVLARPVGQQVWSSIALAVHLSRLPQNRESPTSGLCL